MSKTAKDSAEAPVSGPGQPINGAADALCAAFASLHTPDEWRRFLTDLCTPAELRALAARWQVAQLLDAGQLSYREISERTGASTTTVGRVARFLFEEPHQGYRLALDRLARKDTAS